MISREGMLLLIVYLAALLSTVKPLGDYLAAVMEGNFRLVKWAMPWERRILGLCGARPDSEMDWRAYALSMLTFSAAGVLTVYAAQRLQGLLPFNPQRLAGVKPPDLAMNTAISFVTNTNWQTYAGETTMSHLTQMAALTVQNFLSAAAGIAVLFAFMRGLARSQAETLGNFWTDIYRATVYILLPLSFVFALVLVGQGVIQNFQPPREIPLLEPVRYAQPKMDTAGNLVLNEQGQPRMDAILSRTQSLPMGPVASQEAVKMLGTNGGGFFNANSAHPFENPTPLANFLQMLAILLLPAALCVAFGRIVGDARQGWAVLGAMTILLIAMALVIFAFEAKDNPLLTAIGLDPSAGNFEGKEVRFGVAASGLFATLTTAASCGAVNSMHSSFLPLGGLIPLWLMQLGEVVFGGVGSGLYGMLIFALLAVFIAGLMIGRTPEYLGKKIGPFEIKMAAIVIILPPLLVLAGTAVSVLTETGRAGHLNPGPHGFSEILYAFSSAANNNGSAFAGLSANSPYYNAMLGAAMWLGRFGTIIPVLAIAGSLAAKKKIPAGEGTLPTHGLLFVLLLMSIVIVVGALTYIPSLALGPLAEHLLLGTGR